MYFELFVEIAEDIDFSDAAAWSPIWQTLDIGQLEACLDRYKEFIQEAVSTYSGDYTLDESVGYKTEIGNLNERYSNLEEYTNYVKKTIESSDYNESDDSTETTKPSHKDNGFIDEFSHLSDDIFKN